MAEMRDVTDTFVKRAEFQNELNKFRTKVLNFPAVKDCQVELTSLKGRKVGNNTFDLVARGQIEVSGPMAMKVRLEAEGDAEMDASKRVIIIKEVRILNDIGGVMGRLMSWTGMTKGSSIKLNQTDAQVLSASLT